MSAPVWLTREDVLAFHEEQLREHGGLAGIRDEDALDGALGRPLNMFACEKPDMPALAAAYAHGIVMNHPFNDGNKRLAFICAYVFLGLNGMQITMTETKTVDVMLGLAKGEVTQERFADLLRQHSR